MSDRQSQPVPSTLATLTSDGTAVKEDPVLGSLMVRVSMACNALGAQFWFVKHAGTDARYAVFERNRVWSLTLISALTYEALGLARENMAVLRPLATEGGASGELLKEIGQLCAGKGPAAPHLGRARNQLAFHWDDEPVAAVLRDLADSEKLRWVEFDEPKVEEIVYPFGVRVLAYAMLPDAVSVIGNDEEVGAKVKQSMTELTAATVTVENFFEAAIRGFLARHLRARAASTKAPLAESSKVSDAPTE